MMNKPIFFAFLLLSTSISMVSTSIHAQEKTGGVKATDDAKASTDDAKATDDVKATDAKATGDASSETAPGASTGTKAGSTSIGDKPVSSAASPSVTFGEVADLPDAPKADAPPPATKDAKEGGGKPIDDVTAKKPKVPAEDRGVSRPKANKPRMLVMDLNDKGAGPEVTAALTAAMNQQAIKSYNGTVTTAEEIRLTLTVTAQQQLTGCDEPRCMADVGKTIEADIVLGGNVTKVGDDIVITILSTNARNGQRMGSVQRKVPLHRDLYYYAAQQLTSLVITGRVVSSRVPVRIVASQDSVEVLVDGRALGYAPLTVDLDPGVHDIQMKQSGYVPWKAAVTVVDGLPLQVNATLTANRISLWPVAVGAGVVSTLFGAMALVSLEFAYENYNGGLGLGDVAHDKAWPVLVDFLPRGADSYRQIKSFNAAELATLQSRTNNFAVLAIIGGSVAGVFALSGAALLTADLILE